jgi:hypothetical protein
VAEEVRVDALGLESCLLGEATQDEECAGTGQRTALRVEKELRAMSAVEKRPAPRQVTPECLRRLSPDRNDSLLVALSDDAHEAVVEVDTTFRKAHGFRHAQSGAVEELHERPIPECPRRDAVGRLDQAHGFAR